MAKVQISKIKVRRGQELQTGIPRLDPGEFGWAEDTEHLYIGKRISEGAVDDENSRILTDNDLNNIFSLIYGTGSAASTSSYRYREGVDYIESSTSTIAIKLDNWVSLTDYGVVETSTATDITAQFRRAVQNLFWQDGTNGGQEFKRIDARRKLIVPAGEYIISETIELPPYASIVGEGPGLTKITFNPNQTINPYAMFATVDARGNNFNSDSGIPPEFNNPSVYDGLNAREVSIEGMTLQYTSTSTTNSALVSLQEVVDVNIKNVEFGTDQAVSVTDTGLGIEIRSNVAGFSDINLAPAGNITIEGCKFTSLAAAISQTNGTLNKFSIKENIFNNLQSGITLSSEDSGNPGPSFGVIDSNRFEKIAQSAVVIGQVGTVIPSYVVTSNNSYRDVGNGLALDGNVAMDNIYQLSYPVIAFNSPGNRSVDESFSRRDFANNFPVPGTFYYNPLVTGTGTFIDNATHYRVVSDYTTDVINLPLTSGDQMVTIEYQMRNTNYARKGKLLVNIVGLDYIYSSYRNNDPIGTVSDYYNYSCFAGITDPTIDVTSPQAGDYNYVTIQVTVDPEDLATNGSYVFEYQITTVL